MRPAVLWGANGHRAIWLTTRLIPVRTSLTRASRASPLSRRSGVHVSFLSAGLCPDRRGVISCGQGRRKYVPHVALMRRVIVPH